MKDYNNLCNVNNFIIRNVKTLKGNEGNNRVFKNIGIISKYYDRTELLVSLKFIIEKIFIQDYSKNQKKLSRFIFLPTHHNLYKEYEILSSFNSYKEVDPDYATCDMIFIKYIEEMRKIKLSQDIDKIIIFCLLYRECTNIEFGKKLNLNSHIEFTATQTAEDIPDIVNYFINFYVDVWNEFFKISLNECLTLCYDFLEWIYINNYTTSRIFEEKNK